MAKTGTDGTTEPATPTPTLANDDLERFADRVENLELERRAAVDAIAAVLAEAAEAGHHKKALKAVVKRRLESPEQRAERESFEDALDRMLSRLGMLSDLPLGLAALDRAAAEYRDER